MPRNDIACWKSLVPTFEHSSDDNFGKVKTCWCFFSKCFLYRRCSWKPALAQNSSELSEKDGFQCWSKHSCNTHFCLCSVQWPQPSRLKNKAQRLEDGLGSTCWTVCFCQLISVRSCKRISGVTKVGLFFETELKLQLRCPRSPKNWHFQLRFAQNRSSKWEFGEELELTQTLTTSFYPESLMHFNHVCKRNLATRWQLIRPFFLNLSFLSASEDENTSQACCQRYAMFSCHWKLLETFQKKLCTSVTLDKTILSKKIVETWAFWRHGLPQPLKTWFSTVLRN